jgi:glutathione synthase/RimK-type ligase-like ATP-grasp enzyme
MRFPEYMICRKGAAMPVHIGIHNSPDGFSGRWIQYCSEHGIPYTLINCYDSGIMNQLEGIDCVLWHWLYYDPRDQLVARQVIASIEMRGISVFPNVATCWHYDDKVAQKYLLESIGAPIIRTYVLLNRQEALAWVKAAQFPKVFKLRCGAGSLNVRLVKTRGEAAALCRRAFSQGFRPVAGYLGDAKTKMGKIKSMGQFAEKLMRMPRAVLNISRQQRFLPRQIGYVYFQDFLAGNSYDTRITVIGNRAFGFTRDVRPNDFRASGSGRINYDTSKVDMRCVEIAFDVADKLGTQSLAFDFLFDDHIEPRIAEISYCYVSEAVYNCPGFWDRGLNWWEGHLWPEDAILIDLLERASRRDTAHI